MVSCKPLPFLHTSWRSSQHPLLLYFRQPDTPGAPSAWAPVTSVSRQWAPGWGARSSHWIREHVVAPVLFGRDMVSTAGSEGCVCADVTEVRKWGSSPHCLSHLLGLRVMGVWMLLRNYKLHSEIFLAKTWFTS